MPDARKRKSGIGQYREGEVMGSKKWDKFFDGLKESMMVKKKGSVEKGKRTIGGLIVKCGFGAMCATVFSGVVWLLLHIPLIGTKLLTGLLGLLAKIPIAGIVFWNPYVTLYVICLGVTFFSWVVYGKICPITGDDIDPFD
jgi:hypothetical protein